MKRRLRPYQFGGSMVEFAIVFPLAVLFVLSLVQAGFIYMAKLTLNHATFMAAREGSLNNADAGIIKEALVRGLSPFYQDSTTGNDTTRLATAYLKAKADNLGVVPWAAQPVVLNPSAEAFSDFGVRDPVKRLTYIPNDNLEWRSLQVGPRSGMHIRDANLLKLRVVYGYEMKVPLIAGVIKRVMCGGSIGVDAFGNVKAWEAVYGPLSTECLKYYLHGRIPIESVAVVEMQSRAERPN